ncbi:MAG: hypothetical protein KTR24_18135 [Saprospiraceae bacterium]|nr:hypothetical protein [Saprospiraceae bacterium]
MKEFMMIFIGGDYETAEMSPEEIGRRMQKWNQWVEELQKDNLFLDGRALKNAATQVHNADSLATDGPFVETKELITGYLVVKANDIEHAKSLTHAYPDYDLGGRVEIREIQVC